jgi:transposase InsO family protein
MGLPETAVSDNGPPFQAEEFKTFIRKNDVKQVFSPTYYARANGQAKKGVQHLKQALTKSLLYPKTANLPLQQRIDSFLCAYRHKPHSMTQLIHAEMFLGRKPRTLLSLLSPLAGMGKRMVQKQAKTTIVKTKITRSFLPEDSVRVQCLVHNNLVWMEGEIVNPVSSVSYDVCD